MATIYISNAHRDVAERLARKPTSIARKPIFPTYMHLITFAAMVGYSGKEKIPVEARDRGPEIYQEVFERNGLDGLVYLLALDDERDGSVLKEKRENECWRFIESYAEAGFAIIQQWLLDAPGDTDGVDALMSRITEAAAGKTKDVTEPLQPQVEF